MLDPASGKTTTITLNTSHNALPVGHEDKRYVHFELQGLSLRSAGGQLFKSEKEKADVTWPITRFLALSAAKRLQCFNYHQKLLSEKEAHTKQPASQESSQATELISGSQATKLAPPSQEPVYARLAQPTDFQLIQESVDATRAQGPTASPPAQDPANAPPAPMAPAAPMNVPAAPVNVLAAPSAVCLLAPVKSFQIPMA